MFSGSRDTQKRISLYDTDYHMLFTGTQNQKVVFYRHAYGKCAFISNRLAEAAVVFLRLGKSIKDKDLKMSVEVGKRDRSHEKSNTHISRTVVLSLRVYSAL